MNPEIQKYKSFGKERELPVFYTQEATLMSDLL